MESLQGRRGEKSPLKIEKPKLQAIRTTDIGSRMSFMRS